MTRTAVTTDQIRQHLAARGTCSVTEIANHFKCSETQIHAKCRSMHDAGLLELIKRPVKVTKSNGDTHHRDAIKAYRIRVQPPENKLEVEATVPPENDQDQQALIDELRKHLQSYLSEITAQMLLIEDLDDFKTRAIARYPDLDVDYEAHRQVLATFYRIGGWSNIADDIEAGGALGYAEKQRIDAILAASQLLSKDRSGE